MPEEKKPYEEIAPRLRGLRDALGLSIEELAERTQVSPEEVSRYESGTTEIPVSYLFEVAKAMDMDTTVLITGAEAHLDHYTVTRKGKGLSVSRRKDYAYQSMASRFKKRIMDPFIVTVPPKAAEALNFNEHHGQEFIYVLKGKLEIRIGKDIVVLEPEDCMYFDSRQPHALRGLDDAPAEFIDVIV